MKKITILGSTGSIGINVLNIVKKNLKNFKVFAISGYKNTEKLFKQCIEFKPFFAISKDKILSTKLKNNLIKNNIYTKCLYGKNSLIQITSNKNVEIIITGIVGISGLKPTYSGIKKGKTILLANKETLITSGEIFTYSVKKYNSSIIPLDSEHNSIFQCLPYFNKNFNKKNILKIIITASGGPFIKKKLKDLKHISPKEACKHPNWKMGKKISIDSSTMVNKSLEIVEAYWLFNIPIDKLKVIIHKQSIIHGIIIYKDGNCIINIGSSNMKTPIRYAMFYPKRINHKTSYFDITKKKLTFSKIHIKRFVAINIIISLLKKKSYSSIIVFNAANEIIVEFFLNNKLKYLSIIKYIKISIKILKFKTTKYIDKVIKINNKTKKLLKRFIIEK